MNKFDQTYKQWLTDLKGKIRSAQIKAAIAVNAELILFYWDLGKMIAEKQTAWGTKFLETLSKDLRAEFPEMKGLSERNLKYSRMFYQFYQIELEKQSDIPIGQQTVAQLQKNENQSIEFVQQAVAQILGVITYLYLPK